MAAKRFRTEPDGSGYFDPEQEYYFDEDAAAVGTDFFSQFLSHGDGQFAGNPFIPEVWQADRFLRPMFGWHRADGTRKYRLVWGEVPRKNGKSPLAAGVALKLTFADFEQGAQVYSTGGDREQAKVVFNYAMGMRNRSDELRRRSLAYRTSLVVPTLGAKYMPLSADAHTKHGMNSHGVVNDEVHVHKSRELYDTMHTSMSSRRQPIEFNITTAGHNRHSIAYELHDYALKVQTGIIPDDSFLPVIFAADPEDDWQDPAVWAKANPNLGVSKRLDYMKAECRRAIEVPGYENTFKQLDLNIWTEQAARWLPMHHWDQCKDVVDVESLRGLKCAGGLDLSSTIDITAFVLAFLLNDGRILWLPTFWLPEERMRERVSRDRVPYDVWVRRGLIRVTPGNVTDYDFIRRDINELHKKYLFDEIAFDRWNALQISTQLQGDGITMVQFGQGFGSMAAPSKELERMIVGHTLVHDGNEVLRWMASNAAADINPAGDVKPDKSKCTEKMDGIPAGIMGTARLISTQPVGKSFWEA